MAAKLTRMTHKIAIQLLLVAESSSRSRRAVGKFWIHPHMLRAGNKAYYKLKAKWRSPVCPSASFIYETNGLFR